MVSANLKKDQRPVMIMAGGTGGHIFPGLAVAKVLRERGIPVTWLGADGAMETRLVPQHDIHVDTLAISGLRGKGKLALLGAPIRVMRAIRSAGYVLRDRKPRAVVAFGGFASGPGGIAARLHGLPLLVQRLLRAGADPDLRDALGRSPREIAVMRGFIDVAGEFEPAVPGVSSMARFLRDRG